MTMSGERVRRRHFQVPESWSAEFSGDHDPADREHFRTHHLLQRVLREEFDIRPEVMHPTRDHRGVVKLNLVELFWLIYEPDDQPPLVCTGAEVTAQAKPGERFGSPAEVQHAQEVAEAKALLASEFGIYPESMAPTADLKGRLRLHFDELQKIIGPVDE